MRLELGMGKGLVLGLGIGLAFGLGEDWVSSIAVGICSI